MFTNGLPYHLSDHFAIYGIVDLHASHDSRAKRTECEGRRADLGKLRDALALEERAAVTQLEQVALDRDKAEQMRMAEEQLADALRREQRTLRARNRRRQALRQAVYGADALFADDIALALGQRLLAEPVPHATVAIGSYEGLHGVGGSQAWRVVAAGRAPRVGGLVVPGPGSMAAWL